jgi:hypothetical protein
MKNNENDKKKFDERNLKNTQIKIFVDIIQLKKEFNIQ